MYISYRSCPILILHVMNFFIVRTVPTADYMDTDSTTSGTSTQEVSELLMCSEGVCSIFGGIIGVLVSIILFLMILVLVQMMRYVVMFVDIDPQSH